VGKNSKKLKIWKNLELKNPKKSKFEFMARMTGR